MDDAQRRISDNYEDLALACSPQCISTALLRYETTLQRIFLTVPGYCCTYCLLRAMGSCQLRSAVVTVTAVWMPIQLHDYCDPVALG